MAAADKDGGVTQPATLQLKELNTRSAKLGSWQVGCFQPRIDEWSWREKTTQKEKQGAAFRCLLVPLTDPCQYAVAQVNMRGSVRDPLDAAKKRFTENTPFRMSRVQFQTNVK